MSAKREDIESWLSHVEFELRKFRDSEGETARVWLPEHEDKRYRTGSNVGAFDDVGICAAYSGPWRTVRNYVTREFRQFVEESRIAERVTFADWREIKRAEREAVGFYESADYALGKLEELRDAIAQRDVMILDASRRGASKSAIAEAIGISRQAVHAAIARAELAQIAHLDEWDEAEAF